MKSCCAFIGAVFIVLFYAGALNIIDFRLYIGPHVEQEGGK